MNFNDVVNTAIKDRNELKWHERGQLIADANTNICWLVIFPFNGRFVEWPILTWQYSLDHHNKVVRNRVDHG